MSMPVKSVDDGSWSAENLAIQHFKKMMLLVAGAAVKYQMDGKHDLTQQQEVVMHIADIGIDCFIAESMLLRAQKLDQRKEDLPKAIIRQMTQLFIHDAQARIQKHASDALAAFATGDELIIMQKGVKRFSAYPIVNTVMARRAAADFMIQGNGFNFEFQF